MTIDVFTPTGEKHGTMELPVELFGAPVNRTLIHQAIVRQRSNERAPIAHAKSRGEVAGSTKKIYGQKHTGRARRGSIRSPLLRGGGKAFGPRNVRNFEKDMPRTMRRMALFACLSYQAKSGAILGLQSYPETVKTKSFTQLLGKMKIQDARKVLFVLPAQHDALWKSSRNVRGMKTILAAYLNPLDVIDARKIVFVGDAIAKAAQIFGKKDKDMRMQKRGAETKVTISREPTAKKPVKAKKPKAEKAPAKKATSKKAS